MANVRVYGNNGGWAGLLLAYCYIRDYWTRLHPYTLGLNGDVVSCCFTSPVPKALIHINKECFVPVTIHGARLAAM